VRPRQGFAYPP